MTIPTQPNAPHLTPEQQKAVEELREIVQSLRPFTSHSGPEIIGFTRAEKLHAASRSVIALLSQTQSALEQAQRERDEARSLLNNELRSSGKWMAGHDLLIKQRDELYARCAKLEACCGSLRTAFRQNYAWSVLETLKTLIEAHDHLHHTHDCDHHGWERFSEAKMEALRAIPLIESALSTTCGQPLLDRLELLTEVYRLGEKAHSGGWPTPDDWIAFRKAVLKARKALETQ